MAIAKVGSTGGSAGAIGYVLSENKDDSKKPEILAGSFGTLAEIKKEFEVYNKLNKRVKNQATHISISLPPEEHLDATKKVELAEKLLEKLDFKNVPYLVVEHYDKEYEHFHIVAGRIRDDGTTVKEWNIADRAIEATKELEKDFGLKQVAYIKTSDRRIKQGEYKQMERTGELSIMAEAKLVIDEVLKSQPKIKEFVENLQKAGFELRPNISESTGKMNGFSFKKDELTFKSSAIAKNYSWQKLQKNGLDYDQERDTEFLIKIKKQDKALKQENLSNNEVTDKRLEESGNGRIEEEIRIDRINSSGRTDEQSSLNKSNRTYQVSLGTNDLPEGRSNEISTNESGNINDSDRNIKYGDFGTGGTVNRTGIDQGAKRDFDGRDERDEFGLYENDGRNRFIEKSVEQSEFKIQNASESDRNQSYKAFTSKNQRVPSDLSTEIGRDEILILTENRTNEGETLTGNTITSEQQGASENLHDGALQISAGYRGLSGRNQILERRESEEDEITPETKENTNNLGVFAGYQRIDNLIEQPLLEDFILNDSDPVSRLSPEELIHQTLSMFQESLEQQKLTISQEAINLYENKLNEMAFQSPSRELIEQVEKYNQQQPIETQIAVENKTSLEIHSEFLQINTDTKVRAIANHFEIQTNKQNNLVQQNVSRESNRSYNIDF